MGVLSKSKTLLRFLNICCSTENVIKFISFYALTIGLENLIPPSKSTNNELSNHKLQTKTTLIELTRVIL